MLQSNQRAELFAVFVAVLRDPRPLDVRTDSMYVCNGAASWQSCVHDGWPGDHGDLWSVLGHELMTRKHDVHVCWVLGHAKLVDVRRGRTSLIDKVGNDGADALAVAGAATHAVSSDIVECAALRRHVAMHVHAMMLAITKARQLAFPCHEQSGPDHGSNYDYESDCDVSSVFSLCPVIAHAVDADSDNEDFNHGFSIDDEYSSMSGPLAVSCNFQLCLLRAGVMPTRRLLNSDDI